MEGNDQKISTIELRRLLFEIKDNRPDISIRFRILGEFWQSNHQRIIKITDSGVIIKDESSNKLMLIQDLRDVIQFEIDKPFYNFQPHYHYELDPRKEEINTTARTWPKK